MGEAMTTQVTCQVHCDDRCTDHACQGHTITVTNGHSTDLFVYIDNQELAHYWTQEIMQAAHDAATEAGFIERVPGVNRHQARTETQ